MLFYQLPFQLVFAGSHHKVIDVVKASEVAKDHLNKLLQQIEKRKNDVDELFSQVKGLRDNLETKFANEVSILSSTRDDQVLT